jgi:hypothetical protein
LDKGQDEAQVKGGRVVDIKADWKRVLAFATK